VPCAQLYPVRGLDAIILTGFGSFAMPACVLDDAIINVAMREAGTATNSIVGVFCYNVSLASMNDCLAATPCHIIGLRLGIHVVSLPPPCVISQQSGK
jgi:hypothetical protein